MEAPKPGSLAALAKKAATAPETVRIAGLRGAAFALAIAETIRSAPERPFVLLTPGSREADRLTGELRLCLGEREDESRVYNLPRHDTLPYERFSPQPFVVAQRMGILYRWLAAAGKRTRGDLAPVVVAPWTAFVARVPSRDTLRARTVHLEVTHHLDRDALCERLERNGYNRMALVEEPGEFAVRGGIVDVFPPQSRWPLRLELLGEELESIRAFDPENQRSRNTLSHAALPPPREILFDRENVLEQADAIRDLAGKMASAAQEIEGTIDSLLRGSAPPDAYSLVSRFQPDLESVFDFLPEDARLGVVEDDAGRERLADFCEATRQAYRAALTSGRPVAPPEELFLEQDAIEAEVARRNPLYFQRLDILDAEDPTPNLAPPCHDQEDLRRELALARSHERALGPLAERIAIWGADRFRIVLTCSALSGATRQQGLLAEYGIATRLATDSLPAWRWSRPSRCEIRVADLSAGTVLPADALAIVTEEEIFGPRERAHRRTQWEESRAVDGLAQLEKGDYLVHADHGIGTYRGLMELEAGGAMAECLCIEYLGGDRLFLPPHRLNLVQRYGGSDGATPRIDRLGGQSWNRARNKVKKSLRNMAAELLNVHAARELATGFSFSPRDRYFEEFEATFPFQETPDQLAAIEDVLANLQQPKPMDRLVCGDVGYGKTEVAIRAAFRTALDGKQVAILVPTTLLCQQHEATFRERFEGYPVRVESLSRFRSAREAREVLEGLGTGAVDIVIGTHRLLQKRVAFRDLGLLVVDEEHRFGVAHKERIKKLKKTVDVLTLSATPIPRTLQMAFTGVRELSVINTPPEDRYAIRTQVCRFSESLVREAILREVQRGGQVFFVNDRVRSLGHLSEMLARAVPEVKVLVAHGQMKERQLEERMLSFMNGDADVLLCTTIIESGIDLPRVNTILINHAHAMGLAQLYQLRGRVGRGRHRAYAYLLVPPEDALSHDAQRRLEAIQDLAELGSGFRLANMDLEIRGAGNLLGREQSGNLMAVGYDTYMEMLHETIEELRGQLREVPIDPEIRLPITARLPEAYVPDVQQRLVLYKRLAGSGDEADLLRIRDEILDRYGPLVPDALNLFSVIRLKILARQLGIAALEIVRGELVFHVAPSTKLDPEKLLAALGDENRGLRVTPDHKIFAPAPPLGAGPSPLFGAAKEILMLLGASAA